jgi:hypothetical protein
MKRLFRLLVTVLFFGAWALAGAALHVVRVPGPEKQIIVIPKNQLGYEDTYVDTTAWTLDDAARHPQVVRRLIETGKATHLQHVVGEADAEEIVRQLNRAIGDDPGRRV